MTRYLTAFLLLLTACTPAEVADYADSIGIDLTDEQAEYFAEWIDTDCLPNEDASIEVECAIRDAAHRYHIDLETFTKLIWCESRFDPEARNPHSTATGLAQFLDGTWQWVDELGAPFTHLGRTDPRGNAFTAAWLIAREDLGGIGHWNESRGCWS